MSENNWKEIYDKIYEFNYVSKHNGIIILYRFCSNQLHKNKNFSREKNLEKYN